MDVKLLPSGVVRVKLTDRADYLTIEEADRLSHLLASCVQESQIAGEDDSNVKK